MRYIFLRSAFDLEAKATSRLSKEILGLEGIRLKLRRKYIKKTSWGRGLFGYLVSYIWLKKFIPDYLDRKKE